MATIKAYTDIEQSKKLAEILPLKSADMCYPLPCEDGDNPLLEQGGFGSTPCWSLAALLGVLPDEVEDNHYLTLNKEGKEYCCCYEDNNGNSFRHTFADNPVDACVEMILKLNELKML
jgi:hypothetical protein